MIDWIAGKLGFVRRQPQRAPQIIRASGEAWRWQVMDGALAENQGDLYRRLSWVQSAVERVAEIAASTPLRVQRARGGEGEAFVDVVNHPFETLLQRPNPLQSRFEFLTATFAYLRLTGNAYWHVSRPAVDMLPSELWIIPPHNIWPNLGGPNVLNSYTYRSDAGDEVILPEWEVVHFKRFHPLNPFVGLSPIEALSLVAEGDLAMQRWNRQFFGVDNAKIPGALAFRDMVNQSDWESIKSDIREQWGGTKRSGPLLLRGVGDSLSYLPMAITQKDMEFLAGRQFTKEEIYSIFAPGLASMLSVNATEANAKTGRTTLIDLAVWPALLSVAEKVTNDLLHVYDRRSHKLMLRLVPDDIRITDKDMWLREVEMYARFHTRNEVREKFYGSPPIAEEPEQAEEPEEPAAEPQGEPEQAEEQGEPQDAH